MVVRSGSYPGDPCHTKEKLIRIKVSGPVYMKGLNPTEPDESTDRLHYLTLCN
jgi:hypothetical protein